MLQIPIYQVDAFTSARFKGNAAAVCILEQWLPDRVLQNIAAENNLAETAFAVRQTDSRYELRWFTPSVEVDLCGHATLACAYVIFQFLQPKSDTVVFLTQSGALSVCRNDKQQLFLDMPARPAEPVPPSELLCRALGVSPVAVFQARDLLVELASPQQVQQLAPDMSLLAQIKTCFAVIVTAPGKDADFVSRFFAPNAGIPEDPVTGSAHSTLVPYWAAKLGKTVMLAHQISARGGELICELKGDRVVMGGEARLFLCGTAFVPDAFYQ